MNKNIVIFFGMAIFLLFGCATYYQKSFEFHQSFAQGDLAHAKAFLEKNVKAAEKKDRLIYFLDRGVVEQMLGNYEESNFYFEEAYLYLENQQKSFANDVVEMIANPMLKPYKAEDFEAVLLHYYKAINFIHLDNLDAALVEIRRINIKLNELTTRYEGKKYTYKQDAFALNLMGIIYEAKGEINDAFIAYRNAYLAYDSIYANDFEVKAPEQLKIDLLRTAKALGFRQEYQFYADKFACEVELYPKENGSLVFFWLNGLGPVKGEFSLNLSTLDGNNGQFTFANENEGFVIPYAHTNQNNSSQSSSLSNLKFVRMTIPKYRSRVPFYSSGQLLVDSLKLTSQLEKSENIEKIAFASLHDRMLREISKSIGRLAIKQAAELAVREENEDLGAVLSAFNAVTEKADTRNWQTLPNSIYYSRLSLSEGEHQLQFLLNSETGNQDTVSFRVNIEAGKTSFLTYHTLESSQPLPLN